MDGILCDGCETGRDKRQSGTKQQSTRCWEMDSSIVGSGCHAEGSSEHDEGEDIVDARADSGGASGVSQLGNAYSSLAGIRGNVYGICADAVHRGNITDEMVAHLG